MAAVWKYLDRLISVKNYLILKKFGELKQILNLVAMGKWYLKVKEGHTPGA